ncbi:hypothetical protein J3R30DRAFT_2601317 [Lentinula aciculospora]|uniref:Uncharacterized protein n=1 Tax=Lentinula aciculospora TaxID=153920 RepID=A0A9W9AED4_9AGAR|nr:hypothetical protein J3R30DRAFT_2601317 [Lentinula aciculospora]
MCFLPVEIAEEILTKCTKNVLTYVARTNKLFCTLSERILYASIRLDTAGCIHATALRRCLQTLSETQKTVYVKQFDLYIFGPLQEQELNHLSTALVGMSNLKHLSLDIESFHAPVLGNFLACTLRRSSFSLSALRIPSIIECDSWIASQKHLEVVVIYDHDRAWEVETNDTVTRLRAWARQSKLLKKNVFLVNSRRGWPSDLIALPQSLPRWNTKNTTGLFAFPQFISVLYIFVEGPLNIHGNIDLCDKISQSFPAIQTLTVAAEESELQQIMNSNIISLFIAPFAELKFLRIRSWGSVCRNIMEQKIGLVQSWFSESKSLHTVIFPDMSIINKDS